MPELALSQQQTLHYLDPNPDGAQGIFLLHGLGASAESWLLQIPALVRAGYRPIAPDMRGFGKSTYPGSLNIQSMAADLAALHKHLGLPAVHVVGISMGGTVALQYAIDFPECVRKLVLTNTFAHIRPKNAAYYIYYAYRFFLVHTLGLKAQARAVSYRIFPKPEQEQLRSVLIDQIVQSDPRAYRAALRSLARFNVTHRLKEIKAPTLVITGAEDSTIAPSVQEKMADGILGAKMVVIPGAGHAVSVDSPNQFNKILMDFLASDSF
ncbi:MAG: alpha/beta hydrolase [Chloroflexi bacterium]|nr:MAG: alpha/beta hydrolase [Chloroflexota bacterium]